MSPGTLRRLAGRDRFMYLFLGREKLCHGTCTTGRWLDTRMRAEAMLYEPELVA